jgi:glyoxylase I family protein
MVIESPLLPDDLARFADLVAPDLHRRDVPPDDPYQSLASPVPTPKPVIRRIKSRSPAGQKEAAMATKFMHHTGITVSDIAASIAFYEQLGFTRAFPEPQLVDEPWLGTVVGLEQPKILLMFVTMDEHRLELIQYLGPRGKSAANLAPNDIGSFHVAISVEDVNAEYERLRELGIDFFSKPASVTTRNFAELTAVYGRDPDGNIVELLSGI